MAGQGNITKKYANYLEKLGWNIVYKCIPNSVHVGVVPIPILNGSSKQRYPDIVALKMNTILLVEVEINLTDSVSEDIILRFDEMRESLLDNNNWRDWTSKISKNSGLDLSSVSNIDCELILVKKISSRHQNKITKLRDKSINTKCFIELECFTE
ncbi:hypothetical protein [Bowmanella pacifica]|uniref:Uncharacterized protein n=1 Tax=Bowmanella pacifica TaxID=502051 RepID=A0A917YX85_9ALTE|nr:hypothetical protein [Bowmanella pacifica]GGO67265.1 hypothetical protein GCM10010982_13310 [Bowmanella pacifica]